MPTAVSHLCGLAKPHSDFQAHSYSCLLPLRLPHMTVNVERVYPVSPFPGSPPQAGATSEPYRCSTAPNSKESPLLCSVSIWQLFSPPMLKYMVVYLINILGSAEESCKNWNFILMYKKYHFLTLRTVQRWNTLPLEITTFLTLKSIQNTSVWPSVRDFIEGIPGLPRSEHMASKAPSYSRMRVIFINTIPLPQISHSFVKIKWF